MEEEILIKMEDFRADDQDVYFARTNAISDAISGHVKENEEGDSLIDDSNSLGDQMDDDTSTIIGRDDSTFLIGRDISTSVIGRKEGKPGGDKKNQWVKFGWFVDAIEALIKEWKVRPILFDSLHRDYHSKAKRKIAVDEIRDSMETVHHIDHVPPSGEILRKMNNLRTYFNFERNKENASKGGENVSGEVYKSQWLFYKEMSFLHDFVAPRTTHSNIRKLDKTIDDDSPCLKKSRAKEFDSTKRLTGASNARTNPGLPQKSNAKERLSEAGAKNTSASSQQSMKPSDRTNGLLETQNTPPASMLFNNNITLPAGQRKIPPDTHTDPAGRTVVQKSSDTHIDLALPTATSKTLDTTTCQTGPTVARKTQGALFAELVSEIYEEIPEGYHRDMVKIDVMKVLYEAKYKALNQSI